MNPHAERVNRALNSLQIELPSWGFANTGTRFGKFVQAAAASTLEEKFADAAEVNRLTGATPTMALLPGSPAINAGSTPLAVDAQGNPRQCRAVTRKGTACQRTPLAANGYCPSHQHLAETEDRELESLAA